MCVEESETEGGAEEMVEWDGKLVRGNKYACHSDQIVRVLKRRNVSTQIFIEFVIKLPLKRTNRQLAETRDAIRVYFSAKHHPCTNG